MNKMSKKTSLVPTLTDNVKSIIAKGIDNEKLKQKVEEYIEISKVKMKIAREIMQIAKEQHQTKDYLDDLENDLKLAEKELNNAKEVDNLITDVEYEY